MAFGDQGSTEFSPAQPGLQQAAADELARRQGTLDQQSQSRKGLASSAGGIVGAILGGFMGGPMGAMGGYNVGQGLTGTALGVKGAKQPGASDIAQMMGKPVPKMPGMGAMQTTLGMTPEMGQTPGAPAAQLALPVKKPEAYPGSSGLADSW